jgi:predicted outer membrane repeat protein
MKKYLLLLLAVSSLTQAETFNVSTTAELRVALSTTAASGEDDIIVLADGTYKTTDDRGGTFEYISNKTNSLTLLGSGKDSVFVSGDLEHQILKVFAIEKAQLRLENLSFIDGNNTAGNGGAVNIVGEYSLLKFEVENCNFSNNLSSGRGGAVYYWGEELSVNSSSFINNSTTSDSGGAIYTTSLLVANSIFENNNANDGGALYLGSNYSVSNITNVHFEKNIAWQDGGAISWRTSETGTISDSTFLENSAGRNGGAIGTTNSLHTSITNNMFKGNISAVSGGAIYLKGTPYLYIQSNIFLNNASTEKNQGIYIDHSGYGCPNCPLYLTNNLFNDTPIEFGYMNNNNNIANNIFLNNDVDIKVPNENFVLNLYNNYINKSLLESMVLFNKNNLFDNVNIAFLDEINANFRLSESSDFIDVGITDQDVAVISEFDMDLFPRISGQSVDIGPYEYNTTRPIINSVTYTGIAQEQSELSFTTDYTLADGRGITQVSYDFLNDDNYTTVNTYTFTKIGTYTINVKVTDSEGEFSTLSLDVTISELPWSEMTYEQKLIKAISPEYYDLLLSEIDIEKSESFYSGKQYVQDNLSEFSLVTEAAQATAVTAATTAGIATGKQYVQNNLTEFSLVTEAAQATAVATATTTGISTGKQYVQDNLSEFSLVTEAAQAIAVTTATNTGISTGKQYVQDNLSEFSLVTETAQETAVAASNTSGIATGKQYVQDNLSEFSLVTEAAQATAVASSSATGIVNGENNVINNPVAYGLNIIVGLSKEGIAQLPVGWKMISIPEDITDLSIFDDAKIVWFFNNEIQAWTAYSSNSNTVQQIQGKDIGIITSLSAGDGVFIEM